MDTVSGVLRHQLELLALTQDEMAAAIGVSRYSVNQLCRGRRTVTAGMALRLERFTGVPAETWLQLQAGEDLRLARLDLAAEISAIIPFSEMAENV